MSKASSITLFESVIESIERQVTNFNALYSIFNGCDHDVQDRITGYLTNRELFILGATCTRLYRKITMAKLKSREKDSSRRSRPAAQQLGFLSKLSTGLPLNDHELRDAYELYRSEGLSHLIDAIRVVDGIRDPLPRELVATVQRYVFGKANESEREFANALMIYLRRRHDLLASFKGYGNINNNLNCSNSAQLIAPPKPRGVYRMLTNRALFEKFDVDGDGVLSVEELSKLIECDGAVDVQGSALIAERITERFGDPQTSNSTGAVGLRWHEFNSLWDHIKLTWKDFVTAEPHNTTNDPTPTHRSSKTDSSRAQSASQSDSSRAESTSQSDSSRAKSASQSDSSRAKSASQSDSSRAQSASQSDSSRAQSASQSDSSRAQSASQSDSSRASNVSGRLYEGDLNDGSFDSDIHGDASILSSGSTSMSTQVDTTIHINPETHSFLADEEGLTESSRSSDDNISETSSFGSSSYEMVSDFESSESPARTLISVSEFGSSRSTSSSPSSIGSSIEQTSNMSSFHLSTGERSSSANSISVPSIGAPHASSENAT